MCKCMLMFICVHVFAYVCKTRLVGTDMCLCVCMNMLICVHISVIEEDPV